MDPRLIAEYCKCSTMTPLEIVEFALANKDVQKEAIAQWAVKRRQALEADIESAEWLIEEKKREIEALS